ncbi:Hypothetical protein NTJ_13515 [Nesidiocoris tenuis]|nr:Hypothetical protein NTJ_13515 [Nesidiocoris tenuis]
MMIVKAVLSVLLVVGHRIAGEEVEAAAYGGQPQAGRANMAGILDPNDPTMPYEQQQQQQPGAPIAVPPGAQVHPGVPEPPMANGQDIHPQPLPENEAYGSGHEFNSFQIRQRPPQYHSHAPAVLQPILIPYPTCPTCNACPTCSCQAPTPCCQQTRCMPVQTSCGCDTCQQPIVRQEPTYQPKYVIQPIPNSMPPMGRGRVSRLLTPS